jgi:hypothetical protein
MTRATLLSIVLLSACGTTSPVVSESDLAGTFSAHVDGERIMPDGSIVPFDANGTLQVISGARALSVDPMAGHHERRVRRGRRGNHQPQRADHLHRSR